MDQRFVSAPTLYFLELLLYDTSNGKIFNSFSVNSFIHWNSKHLHQNFLSSNIWFMTTSSYLSSNLIFKTLDYIWHLTCKCILILDENCGGTRRYRQSISFFYQNHSRTLRNRHKNSSKSVQLFRRSLVTFTYMYKDVFYMLYFCVLACQSNCSLRDEAET